MPVDLSTPATLPTASTHHQVAIATGSRLVFVAGQVALDADGNRVGDGDTAAQVEQCYVNVAAALVSAGATFDDVVKFTVYTTDLTSAGLRAFGEGLGRACARLGIGRGFDHVRLTCSARVRRTASRRPGSSPLRHRPARCPVDDGRDDVHPPDTSGV